VLDVAAGRFVLDAPAGVTGIDDLAFDAAAGLAFLSGGGNRAVAVFAAPAQAGSAAFTRVGVVAPSGKNSILDREARLYYTTVPHDAATGKAAFVAVYKY